MRPLLVLSLISLVLAGCASQPSRPRRDPILMTLTLSATSGDPSHPINATVRLTNLGEEAATLLASCSRAGFGPGVHAPDRANILDACEECAPPVPCPVMLCAPIQLRPGQTIERSVEYSGTLYDCAGPYDGPAGTYSVEAGTALSFGSGTVDTVSAVATFAWSTTAPR